MMRPPRRWLVLALLAGPVLDAVVARADEPVAPLATPAGDPTAASALIEQGIDLRQAQRDAEALELFLKAQTIAPSPRGQAQVALAQQALGRWAAAEKNLKEAIAASDDAWIAQRRPILDRALAVIQSHLGDVHIAGAASGQVFVDGVRVEDEGALTHLRLEVGWRTIEVRAQGMYPVSRKVEVRAGEVDRIEIVQRPLLDDPTVTPPVVAPVVVKGDAGHAQRTLAWGLLGGAGLFVVTGVAGLIEHNVQANDFNANATCVHELTLTGQCATWYNNGSTAQTVEVVGFVGAGLFAAVSATLLLTAPCKPKTGTVAMPWSCTSTKGGALCGVSGTF